MSVFVLEKNLHGALQLRWVDRPRMNPLCLDFADPRFLRRLREGAGRKSLLRKALGGETQGLRVLDATAGLGNETVLMAAMGCEVLALERQAHLYALFADAMARGLSHPDLAPVLARIQLQQGDALGFLRQKAPQSWDVVYLDPMYPHRDTHALPPGEMQLLRELCGEQDDSEVLELLRAARAAARHRVLLKRPTWAPVLDLEGKAPRSSTEGKLVRWDVYAG